MRDRKIIRLTKIPEIDIVTELIEYMVYFKLSYPTVIKILVKYS